MLDRYVAAAGHALGEVAATQGEANAALLAPYLDRRRRRP
jgi:hypothetical protein